MNNNSKISVIIPVYGVEDYIEKCIQSLLNQTHKNFEALIIDDGSLDNSIKIAKNLIKEDPRFIFLEKENGGQASARNLGLDNAKGAFIAFLDSDDYIEPNYLSELYGKIQAEHADIATCNINFVDLKGNITRKFINNVEEYYKSKDFLLCKYHISTFVWDKLFRANLFNNMRFDNNIRTYEDAHFTFKVVYNKKIVHVDHFLHNYVQRPGSTSHDLKPTYIQDRIAVKNSHLNFAEQHRSSFPECSSYINFCYLKTFIYFTATNLARYSKNYSEDIITLTKEIDPKVFTFKNILSLIKTEPKVGLSLFLFKISPTLFQYLVKIWFRNAVA